MVKSNFKSDVTQTQRHEHLTPHRNSSLYLKNTHSESIIGTDINQKMAFSLPAVRYPSGDVPVASTSSTATARSSILPNPLVASSKMFRMDHVYISDMRGNVEWGGWYTARFICPSGMVAGDGFVPPNILFGNCNLLQTVKCYDASQSKVKLQSFVPQKKGAEGRVVNGVHITSEALSHIKGKHSLHQQPSFHFHSNRKDVKFYHTDANPISVFSHPDVVVPCIRATIQYPDKLITTCYDKKFIAEKAFDTEIGHSINGCCFVVRVIGQNPSGGKSHVVSAFPIDHFSPTPH